MKATNWSMMDIIERNSLKVLLAQNHPGSCGRITYITPEILLCYQHCPVFSTIRWRGSVLRVHPGTEDHRRYNARNPPCEPEHKGQNDGATSLVIDRGGWKKYADQCAHQAHGVRPFKTGADPEGSLLSTDNTTGHRVYSTGVIGAQKSEVSQGAQGLFVLCAGLPGIEAGRCPGRATILGDNPLAPFFVRGGTLCFTRHKVD